jgi:hypothetical protein
MECIENSAEFSNTHVNVFGTRRELFDRIHKIYMMRDRPRWPCASGERDLRASRKARLYLNAKACMFL